MANKKIKRSVGENMLNRVIITFLALNFIFYSCNPDKAIKIEESRISFHTTDPSVLFFRNVRQLQYKKEALGNIDVFRLKKLYESDPVLQPAIIHNWKNDEAYIVLELNNQWDKLDTLILGQQDTLHRIQEKIFQLQDKESYFEICRHIYNALLDQEYLYLRNNQDSIPVFSSKKNLEGFRTTMLDYYRLVNLF
ncbi:MAG: hypothetical protein ACNS62_00870 [Candidatus Cyclobacteriaceae bacterium M3_2C_046]